MDEFAKTIPVKTPTVNKKGPRPLIRSCLKFASPIFLGSFEDWLNFVES